MAKSQGTIERINWVIKLLKKDEFTFNELWDKLKEKYPRFAPDKRALRYYLKWSKVNAVKIEENGKFKRIYQ